MDRTDEPGDRSDRLKRVAAYRAVELIEPGMVVGLGAGSTARFAAQRIAMLLREGILRDVVGVPCSRGVEIEARQLGIPIYALEDVEGVDITIDGADEIDPSLNLIKGAGGALLHEKIVAQASRREVIVAEASKLVPVLGQGRPVPVELIYFGWREQQRFLESLGARVTIPRRSNGEVLTTNEGNLLVECHFGPIADPEQLAARLAARAGIVEHGLFLGLATDVILAGPDGIQHLTRAD